MKQLRIGLLLDSYDVPAWVYHAIHRITGSNCVELALVIINGRNEKSSVAKSQRSQENTSSYGYQVINSLDERLFIRRFDALKPRNLCDILQGIDVLEVSSGQDGNFDTFTPEVVKLVQAMQLDILVKFGFNQLNGDILTSAKYGVWAYRFGEKGISDDKYAGYWEVINNNLVTYAVLFSIGNDSQAERILYRSQISTFKFSTARNRNSILWFASAFLVRQMELLSRLGEDRFFTEISRFNGMSRDRIITQAPDITTWIALTSAVRLLARILHELLLRFLFRDTWLLLFEFGGKPLFEIQDFNELIPPNNCFWADPFLIQYNEYYFIFVEEFNYTKQKGHISVIQIDSSGKFQKSFPILEKIFHLSYPCVFQNDNTYFMVPESGANKSIDLYECDKFPTSWKHRMTLMAGVNAVDPTLLFYAGKWWLFTGIREVAGVYSDVELFLFFSDSLFTTEWKSHPLNPVVSDVTNARPAGRIYLQNGKLYRPSQNCTKIYGSSFNINEIVTLSETEYSERTIRSVQPDKDLNIQATHTFAHVGQLTVVDGFYRKLKFLTRIQR